MFENQIRKMGNMYNPLSRIVWIGTSGCLCILIPISGDNGQILDDMEDDERRHIWD